MNNVQNTMSSIPQNIRMQSAPTSYDAQLLGQPVPISALPQTAQQLSMPSMLTPQSIHQFQQNAQYFGKIYKNHVKTSSLTSNNNYVNTSETTVAASMANTAGNCYEYNDYYTTPKSMQSTPIYSNLKQPAP